VRINTALGANQRAEPSATAARTGFLAQFAIGEADDAANPSGVWWYRVTGYPSGLTGWVRGDLLVDERVTYYEGSVFRMPGWSALIPWTFTPQGGRLGEEFFLSTNLNVRDWWTLTVRTAPSAASLPPALGFGVIAEHPELYERSEPVDVWKYTVTKRVVRASLDICRVPDWAPPSGWPSNSNTRETRDWPSSGGWPYNTSVQVVTATRAYQFVFETPDPDSPVVRQVLDSINISQ
jgi:hypothetical protein